MSEARVTKITTSLSRQLFEPGGRTIRTALETANAELEAHREPVLATITETLDMLDAVAAKAAPDSGARIYQLASAIVDLGGFFDMGPMHEAAYSLCDISDRMNTAGTWHWPSVAVHLQAMRLILNSGCRDSRESDALMEGLHSVSQHVVAAEVPAA